MDDELEREIRNVVEGYHVSAVIPVLVLVLGEHLAMFSPESRARLNAIIGQHLPCIADETLHRAERAVAEQPRTLN